MTIYVVQDLKDVSNCYEGIDDTKLYAFNDFEKAKDKIHSLFCEKVEYYSERDKEDLEIIFTEDFYNVSDGLNYYTGQINILEVE